MTQEIYDSILDRCMELGTAADDLFNRMLLEYSVQIASQNGHLCHIRRPPCDLNGGHPGTH